MVQTKVAEAAYGPSDYCAKCFKDSPKLHYIDGVEIYLCGGCGYDVRSWTNFWRAYGLGVRRILRAESVTEPVEVVEKEEIEGVEGGGRTSGNSRTQGKT